MGKVKLLSVYQNSKIYTSQQIHIPEQPLCVQNFAQKAL